MVPAVKRSIVNDGYMPKQPLSAEEYRLRIGTEIGISDWVLIDQAMIDAFAKLTGDNQFVHIDPVRAREVGLGGTIAHGFLTLAVIGGLGPKQIAPLKGSVIGFNYGFDKVRLLMPVPSGSYIRARFVVTAVEQRRTDQVRLTHDVTVEIKGVQRIALAAEWIVLMVLDPDEVAR
jgi:acyl dehydratase